MTSFVSCALCHCVQCRCAGHDCHLSRRISDLDKVKEMKEIMEDLCYFVESLLFDYQFHRMIRKFGTHDNRVTFKTGYLQERCKVTGAQKRDLEVKWKTKKTIA